MDGALELILKGDIEIARVASVGGDGDVTADGLSLIDSDGLVEVENGLLPVSVLRVRTSGEDDGSVALGELNIEISDKSVDVIVSLGHNSEIRGPSQVLNLNSVNINLHDLSSASSDGIGVNSVDQRFQVGLFLDARHVEAIDVVPVYHIEI